MSQADVERIARALAPMAESIRPAVEGARKFVAAFAQYSVAYEQMLVPLREQLAKVDWSALARVTEAFLSSLPPNWRELDDWTSVVELIEAERWCLVWLPCVETLRELLDADEADREAVLTSHRPDILDDAVLLLTEVTTEDLSYLVDCATEAVGALRAGHDRAAQALLGVTLTGIIQRPLAFTRLSDARTHFDVDWGEASIADTRFALITFTIPQALGQFHLDRGDPVPGKFNRHATVHVPDPVQYTEVNVLLALMLVTALLRELDEREALTEQDEAAS